MQGAALPGAAYWSRRVPLVAAGRHGRSGRERTEDAHKTADIVVSWESCCSLRALLSPSVFVCCALTWCLP